MLAPSPARAAGLAFVRARSSRRRGSALALALVLVSSAALVSVLFLQRGLAQWKHQASSSAQKEAFYLAEAGIAEALDALRSGSSGNVGTKAAPALFGDGGFWVEAVTDEAGVTHVTSTGLYGGHAYRLDQAVAYPSLPLASEGFFGSSEVLIGDGVEVQFAGDADEESAGDGKGAGDAGANGSGVGGVLGGVLGGKQPIALAANLAPTESEQPLVSSNGSIEVGLGSVVDGALTPGPDGLVGNLLGALLGGSTTPALEERALPEIAMPLVAAPVAPVFTGDVLELGSGTHGYAAITVGPGQTLRLVGPLSLATPSLSVLDGGTLEAVTDAGEVRVFVDDHLVVEQGALLTNTLGAAERLLLLVDGHKGPDQDGDGSSDSAVQWRSTEPVRAALYAPHTTVRLPGGITWRGSVAALALAVEDGAVLELDRAVNDLDLRGRDLVALSWRTLTIAPDERAELAADPIAQARKAAVLLKEAADARIPATSTFRFTDPAGDVLSYAGDALADLSTRTVDAVQPAAVEPVEAAPEFAQKERSGEDKEAASDAATRFKKAWAHATGELDSDWAAALESGKIPAAAWDSVVVDGVLIEPIATTFSDPLVREDISGHLESSGHQDTTVEFLRAAFDLMP